MAVTPMEERRRHPRTSNPPLAVTIAGRIYETVNWSFDGFVLEGQVDDLKPGVLVRIGSVGVKKGQPTAVDIHARVIRISAERNQCVLDCLHLDEKAFKVLQEA